MRVRPSMEKKEKKPDDDDVDIHVHVFSPEGGSKKVKKAAAMRPLLCKNSTFWKLSRG